MIRLLPCTIALLTLSFAGPACRKEETVSFRVFREISCPIAGDFSSICMRDSLRGAAVGGEPWVSGFILSTTDGGQSWQTDTLLSRKMECVRFSSSGQAYACGQDYALYRPPESGHWDAFRVDFQWSKSCYFPDDRHGIIVGGGSYRFGQILAFGPDAFWLTDTVHDTPNAMADVWFSDSATAHAVGLGWVMRSADAGLSWQRLDVTGDFFRCVQFPTPDTGYACGSSGTLLKTTDAGLSWHIIREGGSTGKRNRPFRALWFVSAEKGYVAGDDGLLWMTENGGATWSQAAEAPGDADFTDVFAFAGRGWAVTKRGRIFYFEP